MGNAREAVVLAAMREAHPTLLFNGMRGNLLEKFGAMSPELGRLLDRFRFRPDAYFLRECEVQVFEVIITHGLDRPKLDAYAALILAFKAVGVAFELWVVDELGRSVQLFGGLACAPAAAPPR